MYDQSKLSELTRFARVDWMFSRRSLRHMSGLTFRWTCPMPWMPSSSEWSNPV
jgi:hypothetical protein